MMKNEIISLVLKNAEAMLGTDYSRTDRDNIYPHGAADCSSFVAACWGAAGFPLLSDEGAELRTSCYEVNAQGFDLIYPASYAKIGKNLPSQAGLLKTYGAQPGDIVFVNFDSDTPRSNKITHVMMIHDVTHIIHTANNREKCCYKDLSYGDKRICAIIRLRDDFVLPKLPTMVDPGESGTSPDRWAVRALQTALNMRFGEKLTADGSLGSHTLSAVEKINKSIGINSNTCTDATWKALGFLNNQGTIVRDLKLTDKPYMRGDDVQALQNRLIQMGYDVGSKGADGIYGPSTDEAVRLMYARAQSLTEGIIDDAARLFLGLN